MSEASDANDVALAALRASQAAETAQLAQVSVPPTGKGLFARICHVARVGWRPASGWTCVAILAVNGVVLPIARLRGATLEPLDWHALTPFAAILLGQGALRSWEKIAGASE